MLAEKNDLQHEGVTMIPKVNLHVAANAKQMRAVRCRGNAGCNQLGLVGLYLRTIVIDPRSGGGI